MTTTCSSFNAVHKWSFSRSFNKAQCQIFLQQATNGIKGTHDSAPMWVNFKKQLQPLGLRQTAIMFSHSIDCFWARLFLNHNWLNFAALRHLCHTAKCRHKMWTTCNVDNTQQQLVRNVKKQVTELTWSLSSVFQPFRCNGTVCSQNTARGASCSDGWVSEFNAPLDTI